MEPGRLRLRHGGLIVALLAGCGWEAYDRTDLQLDVDAPLPADAATLHVCVSDTGSVDFGAGNGRVAFTGIRAGAAFVATVDALDADGNVLGRATASFDPSTAYALVPWSDAAVAPCVDPGTRAPADSATWLLGVRFREDGWS